MNEDEDEECDSCGTVRAPHECPYLGNLKMPVADEASLCRAILGMSHDEWKRQIEAVPPDDFGFSDNEVAVGNWRVSIFFDGYEFGDWDYVGYAISPDGRRFDAWPGESQSALPIRFAFYSPDDYHDNLLRERLRQIQ